MMRTIVLLFLFGIQFSNSQTNNTCIVEKQPIVNNLIENNKIYSDSEVDIKPEFPGGGIKFTDFLSETLGPFDDDKEGKISFIIEIDGTLSNIKATNIGKNVTTDNLAKFISSSPKWSPAKIKEKPVRFLYALNFILVSE